MPDLRQTLAMLAPRVTAAWGPAAAYDLEMRVVPLGQLGEVIDRIGAVALDVELVVPLAVADAVDELEELLLLVADGVGLVARVIVEHVFHAQ